MNTLSYGVDWCHSLDSHTPFIKIVGGGGTGKSVSLARRAAYLIKQGELPQDILVLCATRSAADQMGIYLETAGAFGVRATTIQSYAVEILSSEAAKQATGRTPRLLADFEERILMEDMKVCGLKPRRLREMLKYFYRELSELGDEKESFIQDSQESDVYETLLSNLRLRGAMMIQELSNIACKYVRDHEAAQAFKHPFVLVDDFQNLSMASQKLVELLAQESLTIAGSENSQVATIEPYPYPEGFRRFDLVRDVQTVVLSESLRCPARIASLANSLVCEGGLQAKEVVDPGTNQESDVSFVKWTYPNDEFLGVARYIKHRLADTSHLIHPRDIFVAVPNAVWGNAIAKVLRANGIKADTVTSHHALKGDPRDNARSKDLQAFTRLCLAACPDDATAWRSWCGFGDFLTNSNHWFHLEKYALNAGIGVLEALERAQVVTDDELFSGASVLVKRYREGQGFIDRAKGKIGFALLNACSPVRGEEPPRGFMELVEPVAGHETAQELLDRALGRMEARFSDNDAVRIGLLEMSCGMSFDTVIITGAVEGFYPARKTMGAEYDDDRVAEIRRQERREWYAAMTKARYALIVSTVQKDESNTAAALGMYPHRIRMEDGKSMAVLAATPYIDEMGDEAPGFVATI